MEIIGIICEYNPFHNGHIYHLKKIKEMFPKSLIILVLNGYFLERGEISILTKESKTKIALKHGVDLVIELPTLFGIQSADTFARISLTILNHLKATKLIFGSELNDISTLEKIVNNIMNPNYQDNVKTLLKQGKNYPTALASAIDIDVNFNHPNDLLAISYIKAIKENNFKINPISIKRTSDYHDLESNELIISASNIRHKLLNKEDIKNYLPTISYKNIISINNFLYFKLLKNKILTSPHLEEFLTVDEGIENRLIKGMESSNTYEEFVSFVKTKRYTYNKINRMNIDIILGITKKDIHNNNKLAYIKVLGFNDLGQKYLNKIKDDLNIPLKVDKNSCQYKTEIKASLIYDLINNTKTYLFEKRNAPIKKLNS